MDYVLSDLVLFLHDLRRRVKWLAGIGSSAYSANANMGFFGFVFGGALVGKKQDKYGQNKLTGQIKGIYKGYRNGYYRPNLQITFEDKLMFVGVAAVAAEESLDEADNEQQLPASVPATNPAFSTQTSEELGSTDIPVGVAENISDKR